MEFRRVLLRSDRAREPLPFIYFFLQAAMASRALLTLAAGVACALQRAAAFQLAPLPESMFALANERSQLSLGAKVHLNKHGYERVLATGDKDAMKAFILRLMDESDMAVKEEDLPKLDEFASHAAESGEYKTLPALKKALAMQHWIVSKLKALAAKVVESVHGAADTLQKLMGKNEEKVLAHDATAQRSVANATSHKKASVQHSATPKASPHSKAPAHHATKPTASPHAQAQAHHTEAGAQKKQVVEHKATDVAADHADVSAKVPAPESKPATEPMVAPHEQQAAVHEVKSDTADEHKDDVAANEVKSDSADEHTDDVAPKPIAKVETAKSDVSEERDAKADESKGEEKIVEAQKAEPPVAQQPKDDAEPKAQMGVVAAEDTEAPKQVNPKAAQEHKSIPKPKVSAKAKTAPHVHKSVHAVKKPGDVPHYDVASRAHKVHTAASNSKAAVGEKSQRSGTSRTAAGFGFAAFALLSLPAAR
eukprot:TRINITY_DN1863_c0_g1_i1.p1 TRINITY_DN1863_c0_g1~~TRINITY_DN1863_c0_g1_i1.p1  ORF type:complete len:481 (+),score=133.52 TRINITY_DN1863_c0_g1_i1:40-1482(+)